MKLTKPQIRYIKWIRTRAFSVYKTKAVCDIVSWFIERKFGYARIHGSYKEFYHYFNILPDGSILDCTFDQFDKNTQIKITCANDPNYKLSQ